MNLDNLSSLIELFFYQAGKQNKNSIFLQWLNPNNKKTYTWEETEKSILKLSKIIKEYIKDEPFMLTYGDGVCDVNIKELVEFHKKNKTKATMTAIQPAGRFGALDINSNKVNDQNKNILLNFVSNTKGTIPLLTNNNLLENDTKEQINLIATKINNFSNLFIWIFCYFFIFYIIYRVCKLLFPKMH